MCLLQYSENLSIRSDPTPCHLWQSTFSRVRGDVILNFLNCVYCYLEKENTVGVGASHVSSPRNNL